MDLARVILAGLLVSALSVSHYKRNSHLNSLALALGKNGGNKKMGNGN